MVVNGILTSVPFFYVIIIKCSLIKQMESFSTWRVTEQLFENALDNLSLAQRMGSKQINHDKDPFKHNDFVNY